MNNTQLKDSALERMPPQAIEEEMAVLGCMLLDKDALNKSLEILAVEDFYKPAHRSIFQAIINLDNKGSHVDYLTASDELEKMAVLEDVPPHQGLDLEILQEFSGPVQQLFDRRD